MKISVLPMRHSGLGGSKALAKSMTHELLVISGLRKRFGLSGPYASWEEAVKASVGYDSPFVLEKVRDALIKVLDGDYAYERDGVAFARPPEKNTLRRILSEMSVPQTRIVDFGGGLGGTLINNLDILGGLEKSYIVVEQEHFCVAGRDIAEKYDLPLQFAESLDQIPADGDRVDVVILSGVLQCIRDWDAIVKKVVALSPTHIIVDRQPLTLGKEKIFVQENEGYYAEKVSYPKWRLNQKCFLTAFEPYEVVKMWKSDFDGPDHLGFHFVRGQ